MERALNPRGGNLKYHINVTYVESEECLDYVSAKLDTKVSVLDITPTSSYGVLMCKFCRRDCQKNNTHLLYS